MNEHEVRRPAPGKVIFDFSHKTNATRVDVDRPCPRRQNLLRNRFFHERLPEEEHIARARSRAKDGKGVPNFKADHSPFDADPIRFFIGEHGYVRPWQERGNRVRPAGARIRDERPVHCRPSTPDATTFRTV